MVVGVSLVSLTDGELLIEVKIVLSDMGVKVQCSRVSPVAKGGKTGNLQTEVNVGYLPTIGSLECFTIIFTVKILGFCNFLVLFNIVGSGA